MTYRPLPQELTIKNSSIQGLGLFATAKIKKDHIFGLSHIKVKGETIRTPLGGFYNHSENSNCVKAQRGDEWYLVAKRDIEPGEEIIVEYTLYKIKS